MHRNQWESMIRWCVRSGNLRLERRILGCGTLLIYFGLTAIDSVWLTTFLKSGTCEPYSVFLRFTKIAFSPKNCKISDFFLVFFQFVLLRRWTSRSQSRYPGPKRRFWTKRNGINAHFFWFLCLFVEGSMFNTCDRQRRLTTAQCSQEKL